MNQNILDVLMYLFEHYFHEETETEPDQESLTGELLEAGFPGEAIERAFHWLEGLVEVEEVDSTELRGPASMRIYTDHECELLDAECRGFLLFLEQCKILNPQTRELVLERVEALQLESIDLEELKWLVLLVLFNQPGEEESAVWMEEYVYERAVGGLH